MLIETPYKVGDTVSIKLSSGEELVARLEAETDKHYTLSKPLMLTMNQ
jgi:small nuclear ribonucleoprotein (snRNP)-like protein